ncbi:tail fiber domain-containing protein [Dyella mobilis]|uniref:Tail fiber domain-containing protein n=1 Tax=Dyella mobilis TaxID=1849582 RepID=A0ABS2KK53_9GAMM|nr:tail fiber domain-containing protein [Dyella mobilis]MBM7131541.1 tail fiber domain-containing protein [Dyella mobilis]GLQ96488.1 hypothetical protein GCM10007863_09060 [Dyella mobilis]
MALENDFLVFAGSSSANVLTQSAYASSSTLAGGFVSGVASSQATNKTLRQASIISAMIAQFICDNSGQPAIDNGTISTLETNFEAAILAIADTVVIPISQVTGLSTALAGLLPINGTAVAANKLATARNIALTGAVSGAVNFDGSSNVSITTTFGAINADTLLGNPTSGSAVPTAITLADGLVFSSGALGLGSITVTGVTNSGNETIAGTLGVTGSATVGNGTAATTVTSNGSASGTGGGTYIIARLNGSACIAIGNYSALVGGAFNAAPTLNFNGGSLQLVGGSTIVGTLDGSGDLSLNGSISTGGSITSGGNIQAAQTVTCTATALVLGPTAGSGSEILLRPNGPGSSTGQILIDSLGDLATPGNLTGLNFVASTSNYVCGTSGSGGAMYFRPNGVGSTSGQCVIDSSGDFTSPGTVTSSSSFVASGVNVILAATGTTGGVYLRPQGAGSSTGQAVVGPTGNFNASGVIQPGSDGRVKYDREKIDNALAIVRTYLVGMRYRRRDQKGALQAGFIADAVQLGLPHLVSESPEPMNGYERFKTLDYNGGEAYLANAITELHDLVLAQGARLDVLEVH